MTQKKIKIALLFGGRSAEHEISLLSAASIFKNINKNKFDVISLYINKKGNWKIVESPLLSYRSLNKGPSFSFLPWSRSLSSQVITPDIYFPVLHGPYGEDGTVQGFLETGDAPYVGATVMDSAIGMDKVMTKTILTSKKIPTPRHLAIFEHEWIKHKKTLPRKIKKELPLPLFVKPASLGSSVGITKVKSEDQIPAALDKAFCYGNKILVEEGIKGRELECSILGNEKPRASLPGEIIPFREFYDYRDKYIEGKTRFVIPARLSSSLTKEIQQLSLEAYTAIDCSGMARIDFLLEEATKKIYVSEINTIPGFTEISMYPKLWEASGLPFSQLLEELVKLGFEKYKKNKCGINFTP